MPFPAPTSNTLSSDGIGTGLRQLGAQQATDGLGGTALELVVEELLIEARDRVDLVVVVESQPADVAVEADGAPLLVLVDVAGARREGDLEAPIGGRGTVAGRFVVESVSV